MVASFEKKSKPFNGRARSGKIVPEYIPNSDNGVESGDGVTAPRKQPTTVLETAAWLTNILGISPLPNCPQHAEKFGISPKSPCSMGWDGDIRTEQWKIWQKVRPPLIRQAKWWDKAKNKNADKNGIGAIAGLNHKGHYIEFIDIDAKHFDSQDECDRIIQEWENKFLILKECLRYRTPGGGYRYIIALSKKDEIFACVGAFNFEPDQEESIGEILHNNGGHSLFPPSVRADGKAYYWDRWFEYPPVVDSYSDIGLYPTLKAKDKDKPRSTPAVTTPNAARTTDEQSSDKEVRGNKTEFDQLIKDINATLELEEAFNWNGHNFIETTGDNGKKLKGNCPWHDSTSGTAFSCERLSDGTLVFDCPTCDGGNIFDYRHSLNAGSVVKARGKAFTGVLRELAGEAGLDCGFLDKPKKAKKVQKVAYNSEQNDPLVSAMQIAEKTLFNNGKIIKCFEDNFYQWEGNFYKLIPMKTIRKLVGDYWNNVSIEDEDGNIKYPFCDPRHTTKLINWVIDRKSIDYSELPEGINFINGVVKLDWSSKIPTPVIELHDPEKHYFFSEPKVSYHPAADPSDCNRMLTCLDSKHREILLKVLASSLDLKEVRKRIGARKIRTLFLIGEGNNGKDTLRQTITTIVGNKHLTGVSLMGFMAYDQGRQFPAAPLILSKINWPSETMTNTTSIDKSPSLKSFTTGDPLYSEYKNKDAIPYTPEGICIFNLNEYPNLTGTTQASKDRFAPIPFKKIYATGADFDPYNPDHVLGDVRFKEDPDFIADNVAPAFFNRLIKELQDLIVNGIDYSCTQETLQKIQFENNHLFEFSESIGLAAGNGAIRLNDIFSKLESYYKDQGILVIDDFNNRRWCDPVKPSDPYIKGVNNLFPKLKKLFPKIEKSKLTDPVSKRETTIIKGLQIVSKSAFTSPEGNQLIVKPLKNNLDGLTTDSLRTHYDKIESLPDKESKPSKPRRPTFSTFLKKIENTSYIVPENSQGKNNEKISVTSEKTGSPGSPGCGSVDVQGFEDLAKNESGSEVGLQEGKVGLHVGEFGGIVSDRTLDALTSQIKVVDPRELKQQLFTQEQMAENQIIEDIKSQILRLDNAKDHLDLKHTLDFQDFKVFRAIRAWLIKGDVKSDGTRESILPREFVDIWLS